LPWELASCRGHSSPNHILIRQANGETEHHAVVSGLTLNTDDVIQVMTGTGAAGVTRWNAPWSWWNKT
jgi:hypothetical protein